MILVTAHLFPKYYKQTNHENLRSVVYLVHHKVRALDQRCWSTMVFHNTRKNRLSTDLKIRNCHKFINISEIQNIQLEKFQAIQILKFQSKLQNFKPLSKLKDSSYPTFEMDIVIRKQIKQANEL